ncbi:DNA repair protein RecO [Candidatus Daviesbacteria bacterium]|nr:DNA repair protein RecO [Candidatus Daviesbacteria bacterium]
MVAFKTEGIILKRKNYSESDRILTIFSKNRGKITVLAKGVRKITSRRAGNVELLNRVQIFLHQGKNFLILTEATSIDTYPKIKEDLTLSTYAYHIIELMDRLTAENQPNLDLYNDLVEVLNRLSDSPRQILIRAFEVRILSNLGFWSTENIADLNKDISDILKVLEKLGWEGISKLTISEKVALELERILRYYIEKVLEGGLRSRQFLAKNKNER